MRACACAWFAGGSIPNTPFERATSITLRSGLRSTVSSSERLVMTSGAIAKSRVLVVDDDRGFRHAIGTLLQEAGHLVVQAPDGRAALSALEGEAFDVVLLDVGLPD